MSRSTRALSNRRVLNSVRIALAEPERTLKDIAEQINMNYKTLSGMWYRRGIMLRDIRENGFNGNYSVKY